MMEVKTSGGYNYRWTSPHNGRFKYRLTSPEARSTALIEFILERKRGFLTFGGFYELVELVAEKYHASESSLGRFLTKYRPKRTGVTCLNVLRCLPYPMVVRQMENINENKICTASAIIKQFQIKRKLPLHDIFYLWMDENSNTKVGITSSNSRSDRIMSCAKNRGSEVIWRIKFECEYAGAIERKVLSTFKERPYNSGDGHTEFLSLTGYDVDRVIAIAESFGATRIYE